MKFLLDVNLLIEIDLRLPVQPFGQIDRIADGHSLWIHLVGPDLETHRMGRHLPANKLRRLTYGYPN